MHNAKSELNFRNPYELLVAVMLSAQCTDKRVNQVTPALFERYPDIYSLANGTEEDILEYIKSVSYPNAKALHLLQMAKIVSAPSILVIGWTKPFSSPWRKISKASSLVM